MVKARLFAFPFLLSAALAACAPDPETSFANAEEAFAAHDYRAARVFLVAGLEQQPGDNEMRLLLARTLVALGDGEGAATTLSGLPTEFAASPGVAVVLGEAEVLRGRFDAALAAVDGLPTAAADRIRALAYIGQEDFEAAAEAFEAGVSRERPDAELLASFARFQLAQGDAVNATQLATEALDADPKSVRAHLVRGDIFAARNDLPAALQSFDRALALRPGNFDGLLGKGKVLARTGRYEQAEALATELTEVAPDDRSVAYLNAQIAAGRGNWENVRKQLQPHEALLNETVGMTALYGEALIELEQPTVALGFLNREMSRSPNSRPLRRLVARAQLASNDAAAALNTIRPLASRPDASPAELRLAARAAKAADSGSAASFAQRLREPSPEWLGGELAKADKALRNRQWSDAEEHYESIIGRTGSSNALVLNNLAFAKEKLGKDKAALDLALKAARMEPDNASILDTAGWLLVRHGERNKGLEMLRRAARLDPDNPTIERHLAEASSS